MFRYTRLSNEHNGIRFGFESADMSVGATYYGCQILEIGQKNNVVGIRQRCYIFVSAPADI